MIENIFFNLIAFSLFIIVFFKIIRKNDTNYFFLIILQAIGIGISFIEIKLEIYSNTFLNIIRYIFSIIIPLLVIILELKNFNFSEIISSILAKMFMLTNNDKLAKNILIKILVFMIEIFIIKIFLQNIIILQIWGINICLHLHLLDSHHKV